MNILETPPGYEIKMDNEDLEKFFVELVKDEYRVFLESERLTGRQEESGYSEEQMSQFVQAMKTKIDLIDSGDSIVRRIMEKAEELIIEEVESDVEENITPDEESEDEN